MNTLKSPTTCTLNKENIAYVITFMFIALTSIGKI